MSSISKNMQKKMLSHNAFATILNMSSYMSKHSKKTWTYSDVVFRLHLDYNTHREIFQAKDQYYKQNPYLMTKIHKIYEAMKKPAQDRNIRMSKMADEVAKKIKKQQSKDIHEIVPLSFTLSDKDYGNMPLKYVASRIVFNDVKYWDPEYCELSGLSIRDFPDRFKEAIGWGTNEYDKLYSLIRAFGDKEFFDTLSEMIDSGIPITKLDVVKLVLIFVGYVYGINSNALLSNTNKMPLLEEVSGEIWQEEHVRYKMLWLYESGIFAELFKEDLDEVSKLKKVLIKAPLNKYKECYEDLQYFCNKYNLNIDAITGKYLPIRDDIPLMTSLEFKDKLRFKNNFLKDI